MNRDVEMNGIDCLVLNGGDRLEDYKEVVAFVLVLAAIGIVLYVGPKLIWDGIQCISIHEYHDVTVIDKYVKRYYDHDNFMIVIETKNGERITLTNVDNWWVKKFNSADIYSEIEVGKHYNIKTCGWRVPIFSWFENIIEIEEASD